MLRIYEALVMLCFTINLYPSENSSGSFLRRWLCCCTSPRQVDAQGLLQQLQSEESLVRERDRLDKNCRLAKRKWEYAKRTSDKPRNSEKLQEAAEGRIKPAHEAYLEAQKQLDDFNRLNPGLPPPEKINFKNRRPNFIKF